LEKLKARLHVKSVEVLVIASFFFFSLRIINWFEYPYIVAGGDFRPPLVNEAFVNRVLYTWNEIDFGIPSVYPPRILDPFYFSITIFQTFGMNLYLAQIVTLFLMYFFTSNLMYIYVKQLTDGDSTAAFTAALFLTANVHLVSDREQTAIGFINTALIILPSLVTFTEGIKTKSSKLIIVSGLLFALTYGFFPNYRVAFLGIIALTLTALYLFMSRGLKVNYQKVSGRLLNIVIDTDLLRVYLKHLLTFFVILLLVSLWIILLLITNFVALSGAYKEIGAPPFVLNIQSHDVFRLIAKWSFYKGALGQPYVPYKDVYMHDPLIVTISYIPPTIAFASLLTSKLRKLSLYFSVLALIFLPVTSAWNPYFNELYFSLATQIPLMLAFRESTNWIFFVVLSYSVLIGATFSAICHKFSKKSFKFFTLVFAAVLFLSTSYPLVTGDVTRNWLNPSIKGSYFPSSYAELNTVLSNQYWAILLPQRNTYVVYNFSQGQFSCGNPFPLIFSKPVISGVGTEYVQSESPELINKLHELMRTSINYRNIAPEAKASASSIWDDGYEPDKAVDGQGHTRWSSRKGVPQWLEIEWRQSREVSKMNITFEFAYAEDYNIEIWNGTAWATQIVVDNNTSSEWGHVFPQPINTTRLRLYFTKASRFGSISIWELEVYAQTEGVPKFLGMLGIRHLILEKNIILGSAYNVNELKLNESKYFVPARKWDEITLINNTQAVEKLYAADDILSYETLDDMYKITEDLEWNILRHSVFVNSTSINKITDKTLEGPADFMWKELSPTSYEVHLTSKGPFILVFLESYDPHWKVCVDSNLLPEASHLKVNAFANGWLIENTGNLTITLEYETQKLLAASIIASIILPILPLIFLSRTELKTTLYLIHHKLKRKFSNI